jgi:hypothetical protein
MSAVVDGGLITAGAQSLVRFARATLEHLGLASDLWLGALLLSLYLQGVRGYDALETVSDRDVPVHRRGNFDSGISGDAPTERRRRRWARNQST